MIFLSKQLIILIPFLLMIFTIIKRFKFKINNKNNKILFLISINLIPILLMFITSVLLAQKLEQCG